MTLLPELELGQGAQSIAVQSEVSAVQHLDREVVVDPVGEFVEHRPVQVFLLEGLLGTCLASLDEVADLNVDLTVVDEVAGGDVLPDDLLELLVSRVLTLVTVVALVDICVQEEFELEQLSDVDLLGERVGVEDAGDGLGPLRVDPAIQRRVFLGPVGTVQQAVRNGVDPLESSLLV